MLAFCISGLTDKVAECNQRLEATTTFEQVLKEKLKFEGRLELEQASLEFNKDLFSMHKTE